MTAGTTERGAERSEPEAETPATAPRREPRIMVHVVAYNAASTLARTLDRIPAELRARLAEICVFDDASKDDTYLVAQGYKTVKNPPNLQVFRNPVNRGYGGNQKLGYRYAIERGYDVVVLLHGDGQYAPEVMPELIAPIAAGEADAVFGSRMMVAGAARQGGMPLYKFVGNKILTRFENAVLGASLTEFHSGYRAYAVKALAAIPFEQNTDDFHFDTQIIVQLLAGGFRIREVPIPTYYGDEICHVNGMKYAWDVARAVVDFRRHEAGLVHLPEYGHVRLPKYVMKSSPFSSHRRIVAAIRPGARVLDVGCAGGYLARELREKGCEVVGVDRVDDPEARAACARFYVADLDGGGWEPEERDFDVILFADVLEHLRDTTILERAAGWLAPGGRVIASTGNVALWVLRLSLLLGRFQYGPKGILDETHVRLYTRASFRELVRRAGLRIADEDYTVVPIGDLIDRALRAHAEPLRAPRHLVDQVGYQLARLWPELFAYQFVVQAEPAPRA